MPSISPRFAACYIRVSTDEQVEYSPDSQLREMQEYAARNNMIILAEHIYQDEGISGKKSGNRPAFQSMIATAKTKPAPFDTLLLYKFSRFARNREDSVLYKSLLRKKCGISVISIKEPLEEDNKMSIIMEAFIEAMDEYYSLDLSENVKRTMTEKHLRGELQSTPAFGYGVESNILIPDEKESPLVQEIFHRFIHGDGYFKLAKWMNSIGVTTHRGNTFEGRTIEYILRNPVYVGKLRWNPAGRTKRNYTSPEIILVEGKHQPIIDEATWEAAQKRAAEIKAQWEHRSRPIENKKSWLSGLVKCGACGSSLVFAKPHYWKCNGYAKGSCIASQHITDELLREALLSRLENDAAESLPLEYNLVRCSGGMENEASLLEAQLERTKKKILRLREAFLAGADSVDEYKAMKEALEGEAQELEAQLLKLREEANKKENEDMMRSRIGNALKILRSPGATKEAKHNAAQSIIEKCTWDKAQNTLSIHYRLFF